MKYHKIISKLIGLENDLKLLPNHDDSAVPSYTR